MRQIINTGICRYDTGDLPAASEPSAATVVVTAYGAQLSVSAPDSAALQKILSELPTGWSVASEADRADGVTWNFTVLRGTAGYEVIQGNGQRLECMDLETAIWLLRKQMRRYVGHHTDSFFFVHAGVVAQNGRAILLPGHSFAGKSTLVAALVRAGAEYYSDEFALLDADGQVQQYLEPIQLRDDSDDPTRGFERREPRDAVPVGLVAVTVYRAGAIWSPRQISTAEGVVAMMEHTSRARDKPAETMATLRRALAGAAILIGERGDADETANALLESLSSMSS